MYDALDDACQLIANNYRICRKAAKLDMSQAVSLAALLFTYGGKEATQEEIIKNQKLLKSKVGMFNSMRGYTHLALVVKLCLEDNPELHLENVIAAYNALKDEKKLNRSEYTAMAAQTIAAEVDPKDFKRIAKKTYEIFDMMKKSHPLLTKKSDTTLASLFALSSIDCKRLLDEAEKCYVYLKDSDFKFYKNTLQAASFILAMNPKPVKEKCDKFNLIRKALKEVNHSIRREELTFVAALCNINIPVSQLVSEIKYADDFLKRQRGFGPLGSGRQLRRMYASALVLHLHKDDLIEAVACNTAIHVTHTAVQNIITTIILTIVVSSFLSSIANSASTSS